MGGYSMWNIGQCCSSKNPPALVLITSSPRHSACLGSSSIVFVFAEGHRGLHPNIRMINRQRPSFVHVHKNKSKSHRRTVQSSIIPIVLFPFIQRNRIGTRDKSDNERPLSGAEPFVAGLRNRSSKLAKTHTARLLSHTRSTSYFPPSNRYR